MNMHAQARPNKYNTNNDNAHGIFLCSYLFQEQCILRHKFLDLETPYISSQRIY